MDSEMNTEEVKNVEFRLLNAYGEKDRSLSWKTRMQKILEYKETNGKWPSATNKDTKKMGQFLNCQRAIYRGTRKDGKLTDEEKAFMDEHEMVDEKVVTEWDSMQWKTRMQKILEYKETNGKWPSRTNKDTKKMGNFLGRQRQIYRGTYKKEKLTDEEKAFMDEHQMIDEKVVTEWDSMGWEARMQKILEYKETNGKWPSTTNKDTKKMGNFLDRQRQIYRGTRKNGKLTDEEKAFMDEHEMLVV
jgi:hypothetical protein